MHVSPHSQSALPPPSTITITTSVGRTQDPGHPRSGEHPRAGHLTVLRAERLRPFAFFSLSPSLVLALARSFALVPVLSLAHSLWCLSSLSLLAADPWGRRHRPELAIGGSRMSRCACSAAQALYKQT
ncbi:hypothetical protein AcV5_005362 [Taiwanofungus camphoratus]|nr:hypothetical protein AcV5_005362 [Antrodia cinnamomea]